MLLGNSSMAALFFEFVHTGPAENLIAVTRFLLLLFHKDLKNKKAGLELSIKRTSNEIEKKVKPQVRFILEHCDWFKSVRM